MQRLKVDEARLNARASENNLKAAKAKGRALAAKEHTPWPSDGSSSESEVESCLSEESAEWRPGKAKKKKKSSRGRRDD